MFNKNTDNYINGTGVMVTDKFIKEYEAYRNKGYHTVNTSERDNIIEGMSGLNDISDIFEGNITDDFLLTEYINKN